MDRFRSLGVAAFAVLALAALPAVAHADHFRGAYITWKRLPSPPNTVEFRSVQVWRSSAITPLEINPGVGSDVTIVGPVSTIFTGVDLAGDAYTVIDYRVSYTYPGPGPFTAFLGVGVDGGNDLTCCRIVDVVNVPDQPQRIATVVDLNGANAGSPVPAIPMLLQLKQECPNSVTLPIAPDPDGVTCTLGSDANAGTSGIVPIVAPTAPFDTLTVSLGCVLSWKPTGTSVGDKYALQVLIDEGANAGQVAVDFLIEIKAGQCCGNNVVEGGEFCDGTSDAACPGACQANCTCCGDGVTEPGAGEQCDGADDSACSPSPGLGCSPFCHCNTQGGGGGCTDSCADDVSVCSGISGVHTVDVGQHFTSPFLGSDPCDALIVNDASWGHLPAGATLIPGAGTQQNPPTVGSCSHDASVACSTCNDCNGICTHDSHVGCANDAECAALSAGSTCVSGATCVKPPTQFPVTFDWAATSSSGSTRWPSHSWA